MCMKFNGTEKMRVKFAKNTDIGYADGTEISLTLWFIFGLRIFFFTGSAASHSIRKRILQHLGRDNYFGGKSG